MHIDLLYKCPDILAFKQLFALEKIHGTSAHLRLKLGEITYFSGGESLGKFRALFDDDKLHEAFKTKFGEADVVTIYGEAYGGKQQGMSHTYGPDLKFVAFEVNLNEMWLSVPQAHDFCTSFGIEFVSYNLVSSDLETLNAERDLPSVQAVRNGITEPKLREGIVLRPPFECKTNRGRLISKHKGEAFDERDKPVHPVDPAKADEQVKAEAIAFEWVTPNRLEHVIDHMVAMREDKEVGMEDATALIADMVEDITREGAGEVEMTPKLNRKAIGAQTVKLLKARLQARLEQAS